MMVGTLFRGKTEPQIGKPKIHFLHKCPNKFPSGIRVNEAEMSKNLHF